MTQGKPLTKAELIKVANRLLSLHGFSNDGDRKKLFLKSQKYFEKKVIISTPMGNRMR
jgi:hypothetical protein